MKKILIFFAIEFVVDLEPNFENQRIVQRGKKQILQILIDGNYAMDNHWKDVKQIN